MIRWVGLGVNLSGLGWAGFEKMDPRPALHGHIVAIFDH